MGSSHRGESRQAVEQLGPTVESRSEWEGVGSVEQEVDSGFSRVQAGVLDFGCSTNAAASGEALRLPVRDLLGRGSSEAQEHGSQNLGSN